MIIASIRVGTEETGYYNVEPSLFSVIRCKNAKNMAKVYENASEKCQDMATAVALTTQMSVRFGTAVNAQTVTQSNMVRFMVVAQSPSNLTGKQTSKTTKTATQ